MKIVKEINGCKIEERYNPENNETYYVVWYGKEWNKAYTLEDAIKLTFEIVPYITTR